MKTAGQPEPVETDSRENRESINATKKVNQVNNLITELKLRNRLNYSAL